MKYGVVKVVMSKEGIDVVLTVEESGKKHVIQKIVRIDGKIVEGMHIEYSELQLLMAKLSEELKAYILERGYVVKEIEIEGE